MPDFSPLIDASELQNRVNEPDLRVIDCRFDLMNPQAGRLAWLDGHIPGAVYADLDQDLAGPVGEHTGRHPLPEADTACETFGRLGIDSRSTVVVYDSGSGGIAARAWWLLHWLGHKRVALLDGGFAAWVEQGYALETGTSDVEPRKFNGTANSALVITTAEILAKADAIAELNIIDARDAARFNGEIEPIDPVAGHIPGARNMPFGDALQENGAWRSPQELHALWKNRFGDRPETGYSMMCGSGVTACHLVISACLAGYPEPRLYVGSWSEWIRDSDRPVATGAPEP